MTPSKPTSTGHSSSDSEPIGSSTVQTQTSNVETTSNESESNPASTQSDESGVTAFFNRYEEWRKEHQRKSDYKNDYYSSDASSIMYTIIKDAYMTGYYQGVDMVKGVYNGRKD
jgi:hypothetical protein